MSGNAARPFCNSTTSVARPRTKRALAVIAAFAVIATGCDPGWTTALIGTGTPGNTGDGGAAVNAQLATPSAIVAIPGGGTYVLDKGACVVRKVDAGKIITTVAGNGTCGFSGDGGQATAAQLDPSDSAYPTITGALALDSTGNLYIADAGNSRIRKVTSDGTITTIAGDGTGDVEQSTCSGTTGNAIQSVIVTPDDTVVAGCARGIGALQPDGSLTPLLATPTGTYDFFTAGTADPNGNLWAAKQDGFGINWQLLERTPDGTVTTRGTFNSTSPPSGLTADAAGNVYAAFGPVNYPVVNTFMGQTLQMHQNLGEIVRVSPDQAVVAGTGRPDPATGRQSGNALGLDLSPAGITLDPSGALLVSSGHAVYSIRDIANAPTIAPAATCPTAELVPGANLAGANLTRCDLTGASLAGANLKGARLVDATLDGADLSGANLALADLSGTSAVGTNFSGANLTAADVGSRLLVENGGATPTVPDWTNANLQGAQVDLLMLDGLTKLNGVNAVNLVGTPRLLPPKSLIIDGTLFGNGASPTGANLAGDDLSALATLGPIALQLNGMDLTGTNFSGVNLTKSSFVGANLTGTNLTGARLNGATLTGATMTGATMTGVSAVGLAGTAPAAPPAGWAFRTDGTFRVLVGPTTVIDTDQFNQNVHWGAMDLSGIDLNHASFVNNTFNGTNFANANLQYATFKMTKELFSGDGQLNSVDFTGADLQYATFQGAGFWLPLSLVGAIVAGAKFQHASLVNVSLQGMDLSTALLQQSSFNSVGLYNCNLNGASFYFASFVNGNIENTTFVGTNLWATNFTNTALAKFNRTVDFSNANLSSANLTNVASGGTKFNGANLASAKVGGLTLSANDNLTGATFANATSTPINGALPIYANTTCPDTTVVTGPQTCVGHGF